MQISGQSALVAGGGSGIGSATARHLAKCGAKVAVLDLNAPKAPARSPRRSAVSLAPATFPMRCRRRRRSPPRAPRMGRRGCW